MMYQVSHRTHYRYSSPVVQSQHLVHLEPRDVPRQTVRRHSLLIDPAPSARTDQIDAFSNPVSIIELDDEHVEFIIHARSEIDVRRRPPIDVEAGLTWEELRDVVRQPRSGIDLSASQFSVASPFTAGSQAILDFARPSFAPGRSALSAALDLTRRIFTDFTFDSDATDVSTPVEIVLRERHGVCQDFAHLALACLRALGLPARYVSGYLMTRPPEGHEKLKGADASHAWFAVWTPEIDWVDFDPTNNLMPDEEHIAFAVGREYRDIAPISGVLLGGGDHSVDVAVDVVPLQENGDAID